MPLPSVNPSLEASTTPWSPPFLFLSISLYPPPSIVFSLCFSLSFSHSSIPRCTEKFSFLIFASTFFDPPPPPWFYTLCRLFLLFRTPSTKFLSFWYITDLRSPLPRNIPNVPSSLIAKTKHMLPIYHQDVLASNICRVNSSLCCIMQQARGCLAADILHDPSCFTCFRVPCRANRSPVSIREKRRHGGRTVFLLVKSGVEIESGDLIELWSVIRKPVRRREGFE